MSMQHARLILHISSDNYTTIRGKALPGKLTVDSSLARKFPRLCRARRFTTVFTRVSPTPRVTFRIVPCSSLRWLDASPRPCSQTENHPRAGFFLNPLKPELNPICYLLALLGAHNFLHVSGIRVKLLTFRRLMSYIYGAPILDVSRSHTTAHHSQ